MRPVPRRSKCDSQVLLWFLSWRTVQHEGSARRKSALCTGLGRAACSRRHSSSSKGVPPLCAPVEFGATQLLPLDKQLPTMPARDGSTAAREVAAASGYVDDGTAATSGQLSTVRSALGATWLRPEKPDLPTTTVQPMAMTTEPAQRQARPDLPAVPAQPMAAAPEQAQQRDLPSTTAKSASGHGWERNIRPTTAALPVQPNGAATPVVTSPKLGTGLAMPGLAITTAQPVSAAIALQLEAQSDRLLAETASVPETTAAASQLRAEALHVPPGSDLPQARRPSSGGSASSRPRTRPRLASEGSEASGSDASSPVPSSASLGFTGHTSSLGTSTLAASSLPRSPLSSARSSDHHDSASPRRNAYADASGDGVAASIESRTGAVVAAVRGADVAAPQDTDAGTRGAEVMQAPLADAGSMAGASAEAGTSAQPLSIASAARGPQLEAVVSVATAAPVEAVGPVQAAAPCPAVAPVEAVAPVADEGVWHGMHTQRSCEVAHDPQNQSAVRMTLSSTGGSQPSSVAAVGYAPPGAPEQGDVTGSSNAVSSADRACEQHLVCGTPDGAAALPADAAGAETGLHTGDGRLLPSGAADAVPLAFDAADAIRSDAGLLPSGAAIAVPPASDAADAIPSDAGLLPSGATIAVPPASDAADAIPSDAADFDVADGSTTEHHDSSWGTEEQRITEGRQHQQWAASAGSRGPSESRCSQQSGRVDGVAFSSQHGLSSRHGAMGSRTSSTQGSVTDDLLQVQGSLSSLSSAATRACGHRRVSRSTGGGEALATDAADVNPLYGAVRETAAPATSEAAAHATEALEQPSAYAAASRERSGSGGAASQASGTSGLLSVPSEGDRNVLESERASQGERGTAITINWAPGWAAEAQEEGTASPQWPADSPQRMSVAGRDVRTLRHSAWGTAGKRVSNACASDGSHVCAVAAEREWR